MLFRSADFAANIAAGGSGINKNKASVEEDEDHRSEETEEVGLTMEDELTGSVHEGPKEVENESSFSKAKDDLRFNAETNTEDTLAAETEGDGTGDNDDRNVGDKGENDFGNEMGQEDISDTDGGNGEIMDEHSQVSDSETLTPREDNNFEMEGLSLYDEMKEDEVEDEEILPEGNNGYLQECEKVFLGISEENPISDPELESVASYAERNKDDEYTGQNEGPEDDRGQEGDHLERGNETHGLENPDEQSQIDDSLLYSHGDNNGDVIGSDDEVPGTGPNDEEMGSHFDGDEEVSGGAGDGGGFYADDDLFSIFSDDGRDMSTIVQQNSILREAMMQLRNDNPEGFTDTVSETSDELDDLYP